MMAMMIAELRIVCRENGVSPAGRGLHSPTSRLNVSTLRGIRLVLPA